MNINKRNFIGYSLEDLSCNKPAQFDIIFFDDYEEPKFDCTDDTVSIETQISGSLSNPFDVEQLIEFCREHDIPLQIESESIPSYFTAEEAVSATEGPISWLKSKIHNSYDVDNARDAATIASKTVYNAVQNAGGANTDKGKDAAKNASAKTDTKIDNTIKQLLRDGNLGVRFKGEFLSCEKDMLQMAKSGSYRATKLSLQNAIRYFVTTDEEHFYVIFGGEQNKEFNLAGVGNKKVNNLITDDGFDKSTFTDIVLPALDLMNPAEGSPIPAKVNNLRELAVSNPEGSETYNNALIEIIRLMSKKFVKILSSPINGAPSAPDDIVIGYTTEQKVATEVYSYSILKKDLDTTGKYRGAKGLDELWASTPNAQRYKLLRKLLGIVRNGGTEGAEPISEKVVPDSVLAMLATKKQLENDFLWKVVRHVAKGSGSISEDVARAINSSEVLQKVLSEGTKDFDYWKGLDFNSKEQFSVIYLGASLDRTSRYWGIKGEYGRGLFIDLLHKDVKTWLGPEDAKNVALKGPKILDKDGNPIPEFKGDSKLSWKQLLADINAGRTITVTGERTAATGGSGKGDGSRGGSASASSPIAEGDRQKVIETLRTNCAAFLRKIPDDRRDALVDILLAAKKPGIALDKFLTYLPTIVQAMAGDFKS